MLVNIVDTYSFAMKLGSFQTGQDSSYNCDFSEVKSSGAENFFISKNQTEPLREKTQSKTIIDLNQQGLEGGGNFTKLKSWDLVIQKQPAMPCDQNPEQSNGNYSEDEQKGKQKWREGGGEAGGEREREKEEENEKELEDEQENKKGKGKGATISQERLVSKSLMDTLWAKLKLNRCPTIQECLSLSFEFGMTHKQISQWFCKKRKKCNKEMSKRKHKKKHKRWRGRSLGCQGWSQTPKKINKEISNLRKCFETEREFHCRS
ncbi:LOW QUALITY PROTEIN: NANOG neighbor homeobox-like [Trachypithecus francoisi]|uniref:LOW QUALITY PROTEIN: NANOG neighbor homeobox-like n=1 Tax=Trachypithecus francoisi TaxID=54180 RepID=UPI00141BAE08|nr:LOW QUALITY PROTEIN: NANOG neighbor homeobox-like [Trachypithecus francoisi]